MTFIPQPEETGPKSLQTNVTRDSSTITHSCDSSPGSLTGLCPPLPCPGRWQTARKQTSPRPAPDSGLAEGKDHILV